MSAFEHGRTIETKIEPRRSARPAGFFYLLISPKNLSDHSAIVFDFECRALSRIDHSRPAKPESISHWKIGDRADGSIVIRSSEVNG